MAISAGQAHSMALKSDGTIYSWGHNLNGQLGNGTSGAGTDTNTPAQISSSINWLAIKSRNQHNAALSSDGKIYTWGFNSMGQLGDDTTTNQSSPAEIVPQTGSNSDWSLLGAGNFNTYAVKPDGSIWGWGSNEWGQLGYASPTQELTPAELTDRGDAWISIAGGSANGFALRSDGTLWGWGFNGGGNVGDGTNEERSCPVQEATGSSDWTLVRAATQAYGHQSGWHLVVLGQQFLWPAGEWYDGQ